MIELRWLVVTDCYPATDGGIYKLDREKVLQVRHMTDIGLHEPIWSEWDAVPIVYETTIDEVSNES